MVFSASLAAYQAKVQREETKGPYHIFVCGGLRWCDFECSATLHQYDNLLSKNLHHASPNHLKLPNNDLWKHNNQEVPHAGTLYSCPKYAIIQYNCNVQSPMVNLLQLLPMTSFFTL